MKTGPKPTPAVSRFWKYVRKTDTCWLWIGATGKPGYGIIREYGRDYSTHRMSWIIHYGAIPSGMYVCHKCDVRACIRPTHLFIGTPKDNSQDSIKKGRAVMPPVFRGQDANGAKLTDQEVLTIVSLWTDNRKKGNKNGKYTQHKLAAIYGVSQSAISSVVRGYTWTHLDSKPR